VSAAACRHNPRPGISPYNNNKTNRQANKHERCSGHHHRRTSGTGKGTISARLAGRLGWHLLDSGALYRLVALAAARAGVDFSDEAALGRIASEMEVDFTQGNGDIPIRALLAREDVSALIRAENISRGASEVAACPAVRSALLARQRACRRVNRDSSPMAATWGRWCFRTRPSSCSLPRAPRNALKGDINS
jgi:hypothetical protein